MNYETQNLQVQEYDLINLTILVIADRKAFNRASLYKNCKLNFCMKDNMTL